MSGLPGIKRRRASLSRAHEGRCGEGSRHGAPPVSCVSGHEQAPGVLPLLAVTQAALPRVPCKDLSCSIGSDSSACLVDEVLVGGSASRHAQFAVGAVDLLDAIGHARGAAPDVKRTMPWLRRGDGSRPAVRRRPRARYGTHRPVVAASCRRSAPQGLQPRPSGQATGLPTE